MGTSNAPGSIQEGVNRILAQVIADEEEGMKRSGRVFRDQELDWMKH